MIAIGSKPEQRLVADYFVRACSGIWSAASVSMRRTEPHLVFNPGGRRYYWRDGGALAMLGGNRSHCRKPNRPKPVRTVILKPRLGPLLPRLSRVSRANCSSRRKCANPSLIAHRVRRCYNNNYLIAGSVKSSMKTIGETRAGECG